MIHFTTIIKKFNDQGEKTGWTYIEIPATIAEKLKAKGINKAFATEITPNAYQVMGLGASRQFVKSIYDAKQGEVLQPERVGENYVVAIVTEVNKKGTQSAAKARPLVEPLLRNHKKAEQIQKKLGTITSLEDAAAKLGGISFLAGFYRQSEISDFIRRRSAFL